jgi:hypothetical protein
MGTPPIRSATDGVEVPVDRDPADLRQVGGLLDRLPQRERAPLVYRSDRGMQVTNVTIVPD